MGANFIYLYTQLSGYSAAIAFVAVIFTSLVLLSWLALRLIIRRTVTGRTKDPVVYLCQTCPLRRR